MSTTKTTTLTFRIEPSLKEALRTAAAREHRSIANMVEVLILDYCGRNDIELHEQEGSAARTTKGKKRSAGTGIPQEREVSGQAVTGRKTKNG